MADNTLYIYPVNETHIQLDGDHGMLMDLHEYFTYEVPGAQWTFAYIEKLWDGKIRLLDGRSFKIYKGLMPYVEMFAQAKNWTINKDPRLEIRNEKFDAKTFCDSLNLTKVPYDFQYEAIQRAVDENRATFISPTSSGKSLIIYCLARYYLKNMFDQNLKILVTEPTTRLVKQMLTEWKDYCPDFPIEKLVHQIYDGETKETIKPIVISTWQALYEQKAPFFKKYGVIMVDEAHGIKANEMKGLLERSFDCKYRFGFTGTLDELECNRLVIEGLTGPAIQVAKTKELMERGIVSQLTVQCMIVKYPDHVRDQNKKMKWHDEVDFIVNSQARNNFIANLVMACKPKDNILILTEYHDKKKHCDILKEVIARKCPNKKIVIVHGKTKEDSEAVRRYMENNTDVVLIATFGVFSTGVSINNIQNLIFATFSKSTIKVLQSIGRGLRLDGKANTIQAFDIVDDFGYKGLRNHLVKHFFERIKIYLKEGFIYKTHNINIS